MLEQWGKRANQLKTETLALYLAYHHPKTPFHAKIVVALVVAYAFSPIDLIPDFIPILGYLDDLVLLPLGIALALYFIPSNIMNECREQAKSLTDRPLNHWMVFVIGLIWIFAALGFISFVLRLLS